MAYALGGWIRGYLKITRLQAPFVAACAILCFALPPTVTGRNSNKDDAKNAPAEALIEKALAASDLCTPGSAPFELRGTISVNDAKRQVARGTYLLIWAAPDQWREEIQFNDYSRIRVGGKSQYSQSRSSDYELLPIYDFSSAFRFPQDLRALLQTGADKANLEVKKRKTNGRQLECVRFVPPEFSSPDQYCFDAQTSVLVGEENTRWGNGGMAKYSNFSAFDGKLFPATIQFQRDGTTTVQFQLDKISPLGKVDPKSFIAPPNAEVWADCANGTVPRALHPGMPRYPSELAEEHASGTVYVYATIGADGALHNMEVLPQSDKRFAPTTLSGISGWRYSTESCGGPPQPTETVVIVAYTLSE